MSGGLAYVTKADAGFFSGALALMTSLRRVDAAARIVLLDAGLTQEQAEFARERGAEVVRIDLRHHAREVTVAGTHYNDSIFAMMHIGGLQADRFIHLDADTVVFPPILKAVASLDHSEFVGVRDHPALSVRDNIGSADDQRSIADRFGLHGRLDEHAVNAGVFGARMSCFRQMLPIMEATYAMAVELPRRDQTLLNIARTALDPTTTILPVHFNFRPAFRRDPSMRLEDVRLDGDLLQPYHEGRPIGVMHYIGPSKPWSSDFDRRSCSYDVWSQFTDVGESRGSAAAVL